MVFWTLDLWSLELELVGSLEFVFLECVPLEFRLLDFWIFGFRTCGIRDCWFSGFTIPGLLDFLAFRALAGGPREPREGGLKEPGAMIFWAKENQTEKQ